MGTEDQQRAVRTTTLVVPCFDEERRLRPDAFVDLAEAASARVLMVDDGSTDGTRGVLDDLAGGHPGMIEVLALDHNVGKAEAVRHGLRRAGATGADIVGYIDADLATPVEEMARLVGVMRARPDLSIVLGSRVGLLGHHIERSTARHYLGRVFATASSAALGLPVYDTQCGAKVFRGGPALQAALGEPFRSGWAFDVELLARLLHGPHALDRSGLLEVPLTRWSDVPGSKLRPLASARAALDLVRIARSVRLR